MDLRSSLHGIQLGIIKTAIQLLQTFEYISNNVRKGNRKNADNNYNYHYRNKSQGVHVGIWYILKAQSGSHMPTLRPKPMPYSYMDPLGV